jgi:predicted alpha-1,2-mannosidase
MIAPAISWDCVSFGSMRSFLLSAVLLTSCFIGVSAQVNHALNDVNTFIGTGGHGHTFPGACVPNGLVQLSPDTRPSPDEWDGCGGYHYSDSVIHGFSHTHLSGTGVADLCDVLLMPMDHNPDPKEFADGKNPWPSPFSHKSETANAGYYRVHLDKADVETELTATARAGVHRYTWPKDKEQVLVLDLKHRDKLLDGSILQVSKTEITGERRSSSWAKDQRLFFCIRVNKPMFPSVTPLPGDPPPSRTPGKKTTQIFLLGKSDGTPVIVKVGISAVSVEGARRNLDAEVPGWDFDAVRQQGEAAWNAKLGKIEVSGGSREQQRIFYSALYHCYVAPYIFNDVDGNYRGMDGEVHHADHNVYTVFSLWDTFRALHPLMTILEPDMTNDFIKTFLLHYQQGGKLPVWELWGNETNCMIGYHSVSVIADAYLKGIRGFDAKLALEAMMASANRDEPGLNAYRKNGFISSEDESDDVSKTLEYSFDDACIASMAGEVRRLPSWDKRTADRLDSIVRVFNLRSFNGQNLFDPETGFFRARRNGGFAPNFDPFEVNFHYTEANAWQYSLFPPHRYMTGLSTYPDDERLKAHLDQLFTAQSATSGREQADITGLIGQYAHGNEPSHHMAYLYRYAGDPQKARTLARRIMNDFYHDDPDGLIGNEDCGQMSAWYVMSAMGLYQLAPGVDTHYELGYPIFPKARIALPGDRSWTMAVDTSATGTPKVTGMDLGAHQKNPLSIAHAGIIAGGGIAFNKDRVAFMYDPGPTTLDGAYIKEQPRPGCDRPGAPIIEAASSVFTDSLQVKVIGAGTCIITENGIKRSFEPCVPFHLYNTADVTVAWSDDFAPVTAHFTKIDGGRTLELESTYANQYAAGGDQALIDGIRGGTDFRTGEWQGFREHDLLATVDLGKVKTLQRAGLSALQDENSWIWYPASVTFAWSTNGRTWSSATVENTVDRHATGGQKQELWTGAIVKKARYVKIIAKNAGICPDWHKGKGGTTWIFADEILIETE